MSWMIFSIDQQSKHLYTHLRGVSWQLNTNRYTHITLFSSRLFYTSFKSFLVWNSNVKLIWQKIYSKIIFIISVYNNKHSISYHYSRYSSIYRTEHRYTRHINIYLFDLNLNYLSFAFFRLFIINLCDFFWLSFRSLIKIHWRHNVQYNIICKGCCSRGH